MRNFRLLKPNEIEVRVATVKENGLSALLYKTARTDYALLDEKVGMYNWQNDYKVIDGKMYCGIGIRISSGTKLEKDGISFQKEEWCWKWNCGVESNTEAEKGQASDAMKRAGFCWGIGTELYSAPFIWIPADKCNIKPRGMDKFACFDSFVVSMIEYDDEENISKLLIRNEKTGSVAFSFGGYNNTTKPIEAIRTPSEAISKPNSSEDQYVMEDNGIFFALCAECGERIYDMKKRGGGVLPVREYVAKCLQTYGKPLCRKCLPK